MPEPEEALLRRAAWVARKSPWWLGEKSPVSDDLAEPLAAWLEKVAAELVEASAHMQAHGEYVDVHDEVEALAVARALLGVSAVPRPRGRRPPGRTTVTSTERARREASGCYRVGDQVTVTQPSGEPWDGVVIGAEPRALREPAVIVQAFASSYVQRFDMIDQRNREQVRFTEGATPTPEVRFTPARPDDFDQRIEGVAVRTADDRWWVVPLESEGPHWVVDADIERERSIQLHP